MAQPLPGDESVPRPRLQYTQAVTIQAPPEAIWPWLVQMGDSRGGLYSYDWLENLMGCNMHSADRIIPEWQNLQVGDMVKLMPAGGPSVETITPPSLVMLSSYVDGRLQPYDRTGPRPATYIDQTWLFVLQPVGSTATRLMTRSRIDYAPANLPNWLIWNGLTEHGSVIMQRKMLLGIKARAEGLRG